MFAESEEFAEMRSSVSSVLKDMGRLSYFELTEAAKKLEAFKDLYMWYRDVLAYKITGKEERIIEKDLISAVKAEAGRVSYEGLYRIPKLIMESKKQIKQNVNFVFALEMLFINIKGELSE